MSMGGENRYERAMRLAEPPSDTPPPDRGQFSTPQDNPLRNYNNVKPGDITDNAQAAFEGRQSPDAPPATAPVGPSGLQGPPVDTSTLQGKFRDLAANPDIANRLGRAKDQAGSYIGDVAHNLGGNIVGAIEGGMQLVSGAANAATGGKVGESLADPGATAVGAGASALGIAATPFTYAGGEVTDQFLRSNPTMQSAYNEAMTANGLDPNDRVSNPDKRFAIANQVIDDHLTALWDAYLHGTTDEANAAVVAMAGLGLVKGVQMTGGRAGLKGAVSLTKAGLNLIKNLPNLARAIGLVPDAAAALKVRTAPTALADDSALTARLQARAAARGDLKSANDAIQQNQIAQRAASAAAAANPGAATNEALATASGKAFEPGTGAALKPGEMAAAELAAGRGAAAEAPAGPRPGEAMGQSAQDVAAAQLRNGRANNIKGAIGRFAQEDVGGGPLPGEPAGTVHGTPQEVAAAKAARGPEGGMKTTAFKGTSMSDLSKGLKDFGYKGATKEFWSDARSGAARAKGVPSDTITRVLRGDLEQRGWSPDEIDNFLNGGITKGTGEPTTAEQVAARTPGAPGPGRSAEYNPAQETLGTGEPIVNTPDNGGVGGPGKTAPFASSQTTTGLAEPVVNSAPPGPVGEARTGVEPGPGQTTLPGNAEQTVHEFQPQAAPSDPLAAKPAEPPHGILNFLSDDSEGATIKTAIHLPVDLVSGARTVLTSFDLSAFRQGAVLIPWHPKVTFGAAKAMIQSVGRGGVEVARAVQAETRSANGQIFRKAGLDFTEFEEPGATAGQNLVQTAKQLGQREESFGAGTDAAMHIPGVAESQRAYTVFLNKMRYDVMNSFYKQVVDSGKYANDSAGLDNELRNYARFINHATGRGTIVSDTMAKGFNAAISAAQGGAKSEIPAATIQKVLGVPLNFGFFSPRFAASRVQYPIDFIRAWKEGAPAARNESAKALVSFVAEGILTLKVAEIAGQKISDALGDNIPAQYKDKIGKVEYDPRSPNFAKIQVGSTYYDMWAGNQQIARYAAQFATGERKVMATGEIAPANRLDTVGRFARSKLAPATGAAVDVLGGTNFAGQPVDFGDEVVNTVAPLAGQDLANAWQEYSDKGAWGAIGLLLGIPSFFGVGQTTIPSKGTGRAKMSDDTTTAPKPTAKPSKQDWNPIRPFFPPPSPSARPRMSD